MGVKMYTMLTDSTCTIGSKRTEPHGPFIYIRSGVGAGSPPRCHNYSDDVKTIQNALNRFAPNEGGPLQPLNPDGICGPLTQKAIYHFQKKWDIKPVGWNSPDGIVDPRGPTNQQLAGGSGRQIDLPTEFAARIPRVSEILTAARAALHLAKTHFNGLNSNSLPSFASVGKAAADKLDRHFHVRTKANPVQRLESIQKIFLGMQTAIGHIPQGVVVAVEEPPTTAVGAFMFTFEGGYHRRSPHDTWSGIHEGSIYLCPKARTLGQESFAYAMIHELAHYVGPTSWGIDDHAYFHKNPEKYRRLSADVAYVNADSYAQFAFDAIGKPNFSVVQ
jgi:Putative peptidoglycan binding domain